MKNFAQMSIYILLTLSMVLSGCESKKNEQLDPSYNQHVLGFSSGSIRAQDPIVVRFVKSETFAQSNPNDLIRFQPQVGGTAQWTDEQTLTFYPTNSWKPGESYQAIVHLDKLNGLSKAAKPFEFSFEVLPKSYNINSVEKQSNRDLTSITLTGVIELSEEKSKEQVENATKVFDGKSSLAIQWEHQSALGRHSFKVVDIPRSEEERQIRVVVDGRKIDMPNDLEYSTVIPAMGQFVLSECTPYDGEVQYLVLSFSEPLDPEQELEGLVQVSPKLNFKLVIDEQRLLLYPAERVKGPLAVTVSAHITNSLGKKMKGNELRTVSFVPEKPQVRLISDGVIVPSSQGLTFPFEAVNVRAVRLRIVQIIEDNITFFLQKNDLSGRDEIKRAGRLVYKGLLPLETKIPTDLKSWNRFKFNLEDYVQVERGAIYRIYLSIEQPFSLFDCDSLAQEETDVMDEEWDVRINESDEDLWDYYGYQPKTDWRSYRYRDREDPCTPSYYMSENATVSQNIYASDLGILAKSDGENNVHVVVSDLLTSGPKSDVNVKIYTFQQTLIGQGKTNKEGIARLELSGKPFLLVASIGNDKGYLRLDDGSVESVSMFEVDGVSNRDGIKGMLFGERGVWRPGDSIYMQFILQDKSNRLPVNHPIIFEWYNPKEQLVHRNVTRVHDSPFYDFRLNTQRDAPTGLWRARVKIGNNTFEKNIRVESVKPNRLRMNIDFNGDVVSVSDQSIKGQFQSTWLHGAPASGLDAEIKLNLASGNTKFDAYPDYRFDDASVDFNSSEMMVYQGPLDDNGTTKIEIDLNLNQAPGMLTGAFTSRVFEHGGAFSIDRQAVQISPYKRYVGVKLPKGSGWRGAIQKEDSKVASLVLLDETGKPLSGQVEVAIYGISWRWWYEHNYGENMSNFMRSKENQLLRSDVVKVENGKAFYDLPDLNSYVSYVMIVKDSRGGHSASAVFRFGWNTDAEDKESSKMLQFKIAKDIYRVEEEISIEIPSNGSGHFIVSLESANEVVELKRVKAKEERTVVTFNADPRLVPNAYIYVAYHQPHAQTVNDLPIRMYGVQPVYIEDSRTHLTPELTVADSWEPEQEVEIVVSEASGKSMEYTLAIVDEGLLQLTRFQTPDPWNYFHKKEALAVRTWDVFDMVVGAHAGEMAALLAIGGDGSVTKAGEVKANRFPPVVQFLGNFSLEKGKNKTHKIRLPNYVGQVRVMLVAADKHQAYGHTEKSVYVKKPLMVLASLPRVLGPEESAGLPVTVFSTDPKIKNVKLSVTSGDLINFPEKSKSVTFTGMGEQVVYFPLKVADRIGVEKVNVVAEGHGFRSSYSIEIDVRPSNPLVHTSKAYVVEPGENIKIPVQILGIEGTNSFDLNVTQGISVNYDEKTQQLFQYPHGCIEQTTSRVFPQLYALQLLDMDAQQKLIAEKNIKAGIDRIYSFQLPNGGIGYWPNARSANAWGSSYAGHFMLEAASLGYALPQGFLSNWISYQKTVANNWLPESYGSVDHGQHWSSDLVQAYRLYTLALAGAPQIGAMNRLRGQSGLSPAAKWRLALTYALVGREEAAQLLIANTTTAIQPYKHYGTTYGSVMRDQAMILETQIRLELWNDAQVLAKKLSDDWKTSEWLSTQTTAYVMLSLFKYMQHQVTGEMHFMYAIDDENERAIQTDRNLYVTEIALSKTKNQSINLTNNGKQRLFVEAHSSGIPLGGNEEKEAKNLEMEIKYTGLNGSQVDPKLLSQGVDFIAEVTIKNPGLYGNYSELALTQIFPSGWEIHNSRLDLIAEATDQNVPQYQDIRDDRVYTYFDLPAGESRVYRIQLTATYPGTYYQPSVYCEAMYDKNIYALEPGQWVEVDYNMSGMAGTESK